jgi:hypothetical protein
MSLPWWGVLSVIVGSFQCAWLFDSFGKLGLVLPMLNGIAILGFIVVLKRNLWRRAWFWETMAVIAMLHIPLILFLPWTTAWVPAFAIAAIDTLDLIAILAIFAFLSRLIK